MKKINFKIIIEIICFCILSFFYIRLRITKDIYQFLHPRFIVFIDISIEVFLLIIVFSIISVKGFKFSKEIKKSYLLFIIPIFLLISSSFNKTTTAEPSINTTPEKTEEITGYNARSDNNISINSDSDDVITVKDSSYIKTLTYINSNIDNFKGREIEITGFVYRDETLDKNNFVIARNIMVCCAADMQITGVLCNNINNLDCINDSWLKVKGIIREGKDYNFVIDVESVQNIIPPEIQYVYP